MRQPYFLSFLVVLLVFSPGAYAIGQGDVQDEVLLLVPQSQTREAQRVIGGRFHPYHRMADFIVAGAGKGDLLRLRKRGIEALMLDPQPWSSEYGVVSSPPPGDKARTYVAGSLQPLYRSADLDIVKGPASELEKLRQQGYGCVEIERQEIPIDLSTTYLPGTTFMHVTGAIDSMISLVSDSAIYSCILGLQNFGTRYWNNANRDSVAKWVRRQFVELGFTDVVLDSFQYSTTWQKNVVATMPGTVSPNSELIVGGHMDSYNSSNQNQAPGADDNASGTTATIEMARVLKLLNYEPALTIRFIGFAAEEAGLRGSASYAQRARQANRDIKVMMNYDMVGYKKPGQADSVHVVWYTGSEAFSNLHSTMANQFGVLTPVLTTSYRTGSDSYSFYQQNYNTVFCIERHFSPYYHSQNDLLQYLDMPFAAKVIRSGLAMLLLLDQVPPALTGVNVRDRGNGTSLFVEWDSVSVPDWSRYRISIGTSPGVYDTSYLQTARSRLISGLTQGMTYYVGVSIVDLTGREGVIVEKQGVPRQTPLPPAALSAHGIAGGVQLEWGRNPEMDIRGYNVRRSISESGPYILCNLAPIADTTWTDTLTVPGMYYYFATAVDSTGNQSEPSDTVQASPVVGVDERWSGQPFSFKLEQNYPNPFNPMTEIRFELPQSARVVLKVYDILGSEVATLLDEEMTAGRHRVTWDAGKLASGVYYCSLCSGPDRRRIRMLLLK